MGNRIDIVCAMIVVYTPSTNKNAIVTSRGQYQVSIDGDAHNPTPLTTTDCALPVGTALIHLLSPTRMDPAAGQTDVREESIGDPRGPNNGPGGNCILGNVGRAQVSLVVFFAEAIGVMVALGGHGHRNL